MTEINAQWPLMAPDLVHGSVAVHFTNDAERIAMHLHLVADHLGTHRPAGLAAAARAQREMLLDKLDAYADRGVFPRNEVLPYRNPIFIDPHGTACAVGQLMIESGHRELAERIDREQELGYVAELLGMSSLAAPITEWAQEHGFTPDELAWIQPAYGPPPGWTELGNGTDGNVTTLLALVNGDLLVAGTFNTAGGLEHRHVARWNGTTYLQMGNGLSGRPNCAVEYTGRIFVGGVFQGGLTDLAIWNGTTWVYTTVFGGNTTEVTALHVHNGRLYAAGGASGFAGFNYGVRRLSGGNWTMVGEELNGAVNAMATYKGALTIGGHFTGIGSPIGTPDHSAMHVAQLVSGSWQQLAGGLDAPVYDLELMNGELYAGGDVFDASGNARFGFARQALYNNVWETLIDPNNPLLPGNGYTRVYTLYTLQNSAMYLGGRFGIGQGYGQGRNLAVFYPGTDAMYRSAYVNKDVMDISTHGGEAVFGGAFTTQTVYDLIFWPYVSELSHVAIWSDGGWGTTERSTLATASVPELGLAPNPAMDRLTITYAPGSNGNLLVRDAMGRVVLNEVFGTDTQRVLDVSALSPGLYSVVLTQGGSMGTKTFIKQ